MLMNTHHIVPCDYSLLSSCFKRKKQMVSPIFIYVEMCVYWNCFVDLKQSKKWTWASAWKRDFLKCGAQRKKGGPMWYVILSLARLFCSLPKLKERTKWFSPILLCEAFFPLNLFDWMNCDYFNCLILFVFFSLLLFCSFKSFVRWLLFAFHFASISLQNIQTIQSI